MSDIGRIGNNPMTPVHRQASGSRPAANKPAAERGADRVELSVQAQLLNRINQMPDVRQDLIDRVRSEIDAGGYITPDKIDSAIQNLAYDL